MEKEDLIQPKRLYCKICDVLLLPDLNLTCPVCGTTLTTCWWALLNKKTKMKDQCDTCKNRFWCWTTTPIDGRIPSITQARVVHKKFDNWMSRG